MIEDRADVERDLPHFLRGAGGCFFALNDYSGGKASEPADVLRTVSGANAAAIFIVIPVDDIMAAVFDAPVAAISSQNLLRIGLLRRVIGNAIGGFGGRLAGFFCDAVSFNHKSLTNVREIQIVVEVGGSPYFAGFNPAMVRRSNVNEIRFLPIREEELDVFKECRLVSFDGKVIVRLTFRDQVICKNPLS